VSLPIVLSIAGSDSGGGAGIQADLKTFQAFSTFGTTAVTAITAQNTRGVTAVHVIPSDMVRAQIEAVASDLPPVAFKTGMLATRELVDVVSASIREYALRNFVLDPVMVATSGDSLLAADAELAIAQSLIPLATVVTPNLDEASILLRRPVSTLAEMRAAAAALVEMGARAALVKGGHLPGDELVDVLFDGEDWREWRHRRIDTSSTHGTGCTLSAAITAGLGHGRSLVDSVDDALRYVQSAIREAPGLGSGHGPLNHLARARGPTQ